MNANDKSPQAQYWVRIASVARKYTYHFADQISVIYDVEEKPLERFFS